MMLIYSGDEISARTKKVILGMQQDEYRGDRKDVVGENTLSVLRVRRCAQKRASNPAGGNPVK